MPIELRSADDQTEETKQLLDGVLKQFNGADFEITLSVLMTSTAEVLAQMHPAHQLSAIHGLKQFADYMGRRVLGQMASQAADDDATEEKQP